MNHLNDANEMLADRSAKQGENCMTHDNKKDPHVLITSSGLKIKAQVEALGPD